MIDIPDSIFPQDSAGNPVCPKCRKTLAACDCPSFDPTRPKTDQFRPAIRLDRSNRHGKKVTLITGLPADKAYLEDLSRRLKVKTGSGGTFLISEGAGVIEVQGDQRKAVEQVLACEEGYHAVRKQ